MVKLTNNWKDLIEVNFPKESPVTEETISITRKYASRFRGSMRIAKGRIWTAAGFEKWRHRVLDSPLP